MAGVQVATIQDLNSITTELKDKAEEHRRWTEGQINDFFAKLRLLSDHIEKSDNNQTTLLESLNADVKGMQQKMVTQAVFRSQVGTLERGVEQLREESTAQMDELRKAMVGEVQNNLAGIRGRLESCSATNMANQEQMRVLEENTLPNMRSDLEEQKAKRLAEAQRLEAEIEKQKEVTETRIGHTAAALRFYVNALGTKLREELTPLTAYKEFETDINQRFSELSMRMVTAQEALTAVRTDLLKHKEEQHHATEKQISEIHAATKMVKVMETTIAGFQSSVAADLSHVNDTMSTERAGIQAELADARSASARAAAASDQAVHNISKDVGAIKEKFAMIIERLNIEKVVAVVRDWQTAHVPQTESTLKELEETCARVKKQQQQDHDEIVTLSKATAAIKGHFKMFHAIASGFESPPPDEPKAKGTGLPPPKPRAREPLPAIKPSRGGTPPIPPLSP